MNHQDQIAAQYIEPAQGRVRDRFRNGSTQDIVRVILEADQLAAPYTDEFAAHIDEGDTLATCRRLHAFIQQNIEYREDPGGLQDIKSPGALFQSGFGDCKSFSVFTASVLRNLGIPYRYRFASYTEDGDVTHVYVVATDEDGSDVVIDAVPPIHFNRETSSVYTLDYNSAGHLIGRAQTDTPQPSAPMFSGLSVLVGLFVAALFLNPATR